MKEKFKKLLSALLVTFISMGSMVAPVAAIESSVNTSPVEGIIVTTPEVDENESTNRTEVNEVEEIKNNDHNSNIKPGNDNKGNHGSMVEDGLKDDLYSGSILKENNFDLDNFFDRLIVKMRGLVENVRRLAVPVLVIAWMLLFFIAVLRIVTGERGATSRLMGGLFWVTFAYVGIVSAEAILYSLVKFVIGA